LEARAEIIGYISHVTETNVPVLRIFDRMDD